MTITQRYEAERIMVACNQCRCAISSTNLPALLRLVDSHEVRHPTHRMTQQVWKPFKP